MNKLVLAEKPSVARSISAVLGANERRDGFFIGSGFIVTSCAGHLLELATPDAYGEYAKWRYSDLPVIPEEWKHIPSKGKSKQLDIIKELMNRPDVDEVINACDAGREGELIFRLVYDYSECVKPVKRLWISSMEDAAIKAGFGDLKDSGDYANLCAAASCRERADWIVGLNATRLFSVLYGVTLNTGRVQSPTLAMLVKREADIAAFVSEPFYIPTVDCGGFTASGERTKDKQAAEAVQAACDGKQAIVRSVECQQKSVAPPKLYDLTTLQREANRLLGFTAQQTLDYAQSLYEKKLLTYPRTDSRYLTGDMHDSTAALILSLLEQPEYCGIDAFVPGIARLVDDKKVTDHHAIIPTMESAKADLSSLQAGERDTLLMVTARLLCAAAPVHRYEAVTAVMECANHSFVVKGKTVAFDGWKEIEQLFRASLKAKPDMDDDENDELDTALPILSEAQLFDCVSATVKTGATTPQKHMTEDTILSGMENAGTEDMPEDAERKGLGTPATRAAIIEKLIKAGFVERQKKNLVPTSKGRNLIAVLPDTLTSPKLTAEWEYRLRQVERGELSGDSFLEDIAAFMKQIVSDNAAPKPEYVSLFDSRQAASPALGNCLRCGSPVREGAKGYFCDSHSCDFKMWKESKFWTAKKKPLTADTVAALLSDGRVFIKGLCSEKSGRLYDAVVALNDTGTGYVNYKLEFGTEVKR